MNRRTFLMAMAVPPVVRTAVSIDGDKFRINEKLTYAGRPKVEGMLLNTRMVQGIFDDRNAATRERWKYPDTGKWDAERNTSEFLAAMPEWKRHGVLSFTICIQGGSPQGYSKDQPWVTGGFHEDGRLREDYMARLKRILDRADELGMVPIVGYFYFGQDEHVKDEAGVKRGVENATRWLRDQGYKNVLIEIANECDNVRYDHAILKPARIVELFSISRKVAAIPVSASFNGGRVPAAAVAEAADFLLMHGNGVKDPKRIAEMVAEARKLSSKPILFNEDDHFDFDLPVNNMMQAIGAGASWGYFDPEGYQCPPVKWGIDTERKRGFFAAAKAITGY